MEILETIKTTKICSKCGEEKELCDMGKNSYNKDGYMNICKECRKVIYKHISDKYTSSEKCKEKERTRDKIKQSAKNARYREKNRDLIRKRQREARKKLKEENPEKLKEKAKKQYEKNKEKIKKYSSEYQKNNKEKVSVRGKRYRDKYKDDVLFNLKKLVRSRLKSFLITKNKKIDGSSLLLIGCTPEELKIYLENQFTDGMSWENHGSYGEFIWHIDHIIPLSSAETEEDIYKLAHYTNLQPMWSIDNFKKGSRILTKEENDKLRNSRS